MYVTYTNVRLQILTPGFLMGSEQKKKKIILTKEERQSIFSDSFVFTRTSTNLYVGASRHTSQEGARC